MNRYNLPQKCFGFVCSCILIFVLSSHDAGAVRRSSVLSVVLFASGMGLEVGGTLLKSDAQERYDLYLNAVIQADIQQHKDAFRVRRDAGTLMSRIGLGCIGLAVCFSIYSQLDRPTEAPGFVENAPAPVSRLEHRNSASLTRKNNFNNSVLREGGLSLPGTSFQWLPSYNFRNGQTTLKLLHHF